MQANRVPSSIEQLGLATRSGLQYGRDDAVFYYARPAQRWR